MKVDIEYIKVLLELALESPTPDFDIKKQMPHLWIDQSGNGIEIDADNLNKLVFHMEILEDQGVIKSSTKSPGLGFSRSMNGSFIVSVKPLRITAVGHDFIAALNRQGVLEQMKTSFKDVGPSEAVKVAFSLGAKALDKVLTEAVGDA